MENTELASVENKAAKLNVSETNVTDGQSNNVVDLGDTVMEKQTTVTETHDEINGIPNGTELNETCIEAKDKDNLKDSNNVNGCNEVEQNDRNVASELTSTIIDVNKEEQTLTDIPDDGIKENVSKEQILSPETPSVAAAVLDEVVETNENTENKDVVDEKNSSEGNSDTVELEVTKQENAPPFLENVGNEISETNPIANGVVENKIEGNEEIEILNGIANGDNVEQQIIDDTSGGEEIIADDAIDSVIKNLIEALQTTSNTEILSQVTETQPPAGYISEMDWKMKETALLVKIARLEEDERIKQEALHIKLKMKCDENEILKSKLKTLDTELRAVCSKPNAKNKDMVSKIKRQHDDLLTKARGMIFEKTKMIKNQELRIEALTTQVASLKDIVAITKDMLNIRNMECRHLQDRMETMELRLQAEKERQNLMAKKLESGTMLNDQLKKEYTKQMDLFKNLKDKYGEKFLILEKNQKEPEEQTTNAQE